MVSAEPGGQEVYVEDEIAPSIAGLVRWRIARSRPLSYLSAAAASAETLDASGKAVVEAADSLSQNLSTGSGQSSRLVILKAEAVARDGKQASVNVSFFRQRH